MIRFSKYDVSFIRQVVILLVKFIGKRHHAKLR